MTTRVRSSAASDGYKGQGLGGVGGVPPAVAVLVGVVRDDTLRGVIFVVDEAVAVLVDPSAVTALGRGRRDRGVVVVAFALIAGVSIAVESAGIRALCAV